jgi:hypothetical protein
LSVCVYTDIHIHHCIFLRNDAAIFVIDPKPRNVLVFCFIPWQ